jgi:hypothetical protein
LPLALAVMPEPPRRILEKSRIVRRRYQRSNKRFQFTASQIERIERDQERERKAQKLREKEKRRAANKKTRADKEAKRKEERKRLGLPDPSVPKVPASQPLLLNFLATSKRLQELNRGSGSEETDCAQQDGSETEIETDMEDWVDWVGDSDTVGDQGRSCTGTGLTRNPNIDANSNRDSMIYDQDAFDAIAIMPDRERKMNGQSWNNATEESQMTPYRPRPGGPMSPGDYFEDDTATLLQELYSDTSDTDTNIKEEISEGRRERPTNGAIIFTQSASMNRVSPKSLSLSKDPESENHFRLQRGPKLRANSNTTANKDVQSTTRSHSPPPIEIYQDPEDVLAAICSQDLAEDSYDTDDNKENLHPNIPHQQKPIVRTSLHSQKIPSPAVTDTKREPLILLNPTLSPDSRKGASNCSFLKVGQALLSATSHESIATGSAMVSTMGGFASDDEFSELDLTLEELQELDA